MKNLINSLDIAIKNENWHCALFVALSIPDIFGKIKYPKYNVGDRYKLWFDEYLKKNYIHKIGAKQEETIFLSGNDCYALRCSLLHEGIDDITSQKAKKVLDRIKFSTKLSHLLSHDNGNHKTLILNVEVFCREIYKSAYLCMNEDGYSDYILMEVHDSNLLKI